MFEKQGILVLSNGSWQKRLTAEDAEDRRGLLFFSASLGVLGIFPDRQEKSPLRKT
jgi:hypothetical protein